MAEINTHTHTRLCSHNFEHLATTKRGKAKHDIITLRSRTGRRHHTNTTTIISINLSFILTTITSLSQSASLATQFFCSSNHVHG